MEFGLLSIPTDLSGLWDIPLEVLADSGVVPDTLRMIDSAVVRAHTHAGGGKGSFTKTLLTVRAVVFPPNSIPRTNAEGLPIGSVITVAEADGLKRYALMDEAAPDPKVLVGDRGFDADAVRADLKQRSRVPIIPATKNRRVQIEIDRVIYALRNQPHTLRQTSARRSSASFKLRPYACG